MGRHQTHRCLSFIIKSKVRDRNRQFFRASTLRAIEGCSSQSSRLQRERETRAQRPLAGGRSGAKGVPDAPGRPAATEPAAKTQVRRPRPNGSPEHPLLPRQIHGGWRAPRGRSARNGSAATTADLAAARPTCRLRDLREAGEQTLQTPAGAG